MTPYQSANFHRISCTCTHFGFNWVLRHGRRAGKEWAEGVQEFEENEGHYNCTIHIHLHARTLSISNNWITHQPRPHTYKCTRVKQPPPLNLLWNQFINYHTIKFKYKYYIVLYYVFGHLPWTPSCHCLPVCCIIHHCLEVRRMHMYVYSSHWVFTVYQQQHFKWQIMRLLSMNHESDQLKIIPNVFE